MTTDADQIPQDEVEDTSSTVLPDTDSPDKAFEERIARIEAAQQMTQRQVQQVNAAVGRVQALAAKFDKTGDPKVEDQVRAAMSEVYDVLGTVADGIDGAILPESAKARVNAARESARKVADQQALDNKVREAIAAATPKPETPNIDTTAIEAAVLAKFAKSGVDPEKFDWELAATLLHGAGEPAMWKYVDAQEKLLKTETNEGGPATRPKASPAPAGVANTNLDTLLAEYANDPTEMKPEHRQQVEKYMASAGVLS